MKSGSRSTPIGRGALAAAVGLTALCAFGRGLPLASVRARATASGGAYSVWGWALTPQPAVIPAAGSTLLVHVDGGPLGNLTYNLYRSDIAQLFPGYANSNGAVFPYVLDTTRLSNGIHSIAVSATDNLGRTEGLGSRYFWVQN